MRPDRAAVSHAVTPSKRQSKPRWKRRKGARPGEIVAAALEVFGERGFAATKLADVARRAGVTKGTVYLYFDSKEALFKAVVRETIVPVIAKGEAFAQSFTGSARELLEQLVREYWRLVGETAVAAVPKLMMAEAATFPELTRFYYEEVVTRGHRLMAGVIERGIKNGEFRPVNVMVAAKLAMSPLMHAVVARARAALLPPLSLGGAWVTRDFTPQALVIPFPPQFNLPNPVPPFNNYDGRVTVTQTLFDWSSVERVRAAGAQADGSRAERGVTVEGAALTAALAYLRAARGQAAVAARQADSALAAELVGLAQAQKAAGVSGAIDVTRARTQLVTAEGLLIVARNQMDRARIDVTRALGLDPATPLTLTDSLAPTLGAAEVPAERDAAVTAALAGRPDLGAELARGVAARRSGTAIRSERLPRVGVEADYGVNGLTGASALSTRQVALQVTLPILDGFRREARAAAQGAAWPGPFINRTYDE